MDNLRRALETYNKIPDFTKENSKLNEEKEKEKIDDESKKSD